MHLRERASGREGCDQGVRIAEPVHLEVVDVRVEPLIIEILDGLEKADQTVTTSPS
jgi:hypothetical protein